jgi:CBS domain containing-hemolysin-like protein
MISAIWRTSDTYLAITVVVLLVLSGFFAMAETSLVRMNKSRARSLREQGRHGAKSLVDLAENPEQFLNPLLLLVLICQLVSATMVGVLAGHLFGAAGVFVATAGEVVIIFVAFEAIPKNFAVQHPDRAALASAPMVSRILRFPPIRWISRFLLAIADGVMSLFGAKGSAQSVTELEVLALADVAHEDKVIEEDERDFIHSIIEFGDTVVREVMVPRMDMVDIERNETVRAALDLAITTGRSRIPVLGESVDDIVGIVNLRYLADLVMKGQGEEEVGSHAKTAHFVPETAPVSAVLAEMRKEKVHLFVVIDEYGGTAGLVTLEDLIEELVGDIADESDAEPESTVEERDDESELIVSGRLNIDDANDDYGIDLPKGGWDTVGGLVLDAAGGVPSVGDSFVVKNFKLTVLRMDGRRIEDVLVEHEWPNE